MGVISWLLPRIQAYVRILVIVINWLSRNYGSKCTDPEGEVCLRCHNSLTTSW